MGLFRKKKEAEPEVPAKPELREDANWHEWSELGFRKISEGNIPGAITDWIEAVDRYDEDTPKYYQKFHDDIFNAISSEMARASSEGKVLPSHMIAEVDAEVFVKRRELCTSLLCEEVFYDAKEKIPDAVGPEEAAMFYISGAYSIIGYLRFSTDLNESIGKCQEAAKLGRATAEQCLGYKRFSYQGGLKPKNGNAFCLSIVRFFDAMEKYLSDAVSGLTPEQVESVKAYRSENLGDRLEHLSAGLQFCLNSTGAGRISERKVGSGLERELTAYVQEFLKIE